MRLLALATIAAMSAAAAYSPVAVQEVCCTSDSGLEAHGSSMSLPATHHVRSGTLEICFTRDRGTCGMLHANHVLGCKMLSTFSQSLLNAE